MKSAVKKNKITRKTSAEKLRQNLLRRKNPKNSKPNLSPQENKKVNQKNYN
jgi:hypothetical protein